MKKTNMAEVSPLFINKQGSLLFELLGPGNFLDDENMSIARIKHEPGVIEENHYHQSSQEIYIFLSGKGKIIVNDVGYDVSGEDVVVIQPGEGHYIKVDGKVGLDFLAIMQPPYSVDDYYRV